MTPAKIPQDVTREDKLVGPLTLRQFLTILLGSGIIYASYQGFVGGYLFAYEFVIITLIVGTFTIGLSFVKVNGRPFGVFLSNLVHYIKIPKRWGWQKEDREFVKPMKISTVDTKDTRTEVAERKSGKVVKMQIEQLASVLDTGGTIKQDHDDIVISQTSALPATNPTVKYDPSSVEDIFSDSD